MSATFDLRQMKHSESPSLSESLWDATAGTWTPCDRLASDGDADVVIVGAGFTGLSCALHLAGLGHRPMVLEAGQPGWGASGRNGGQVIAGLKEDPDTVEAHFGEEAGSRMVALSDRAPALVFDLCRRYGIDCDLRDSGWIQPAHTERAAAGQQARIAQWQRRGADVSALPAKDVAALVGSNAYVGGLFDRRGGTVHPLKFVRGLARAAQDQGVCIYGGTEVASWQQTGEGYIVRTAGGQIRCRVLVMCTNAYTPAGPLARSVAPVYSLQVASQPLSENVRATILPGGQAASDTRRLLHYFRLDRQGRLVIGGRGAYGEGARRRLQARLRDAATSIFPQLGPVDWPHAWGGLVAITADHYPHLHEEATGYYAALGYNGRGVAMAVALGKVLAQRIDGTKARDLDWPVTPMQPIPLHRLVRPGAAFLTGWSRLLDRLGR